MSPSPDDDAVNSLDEMLNRLRTMSRAGELSSALRQFVVLLADQFSHLLAAFKKTRIDN